MTLKKKKKHKQWIKMKSQFEHLFYEILAICNFASILAIMYSILQWAQECSFKKYIGLNQTPAKKKKKKPICAILGSVCLKETTNPNIRGLNK